MSAELERYTQSISSFVLRPSRQTFHGHGCIYHNPIGNEDILRNSCSQVHVRMLAKRVIGLIHWNASHASFGMFPGLCLLRSSRGKRPGEQGLFLNYGLQSVNKKWKCSEKKAGFSGAFCELRVPVCVPSFARRCFLVETGSQGPTTAPRSQN